MFLHHLSADTQYKYGTSSYFDDACCYGQTFESHLTSLRVFLRRLQDANLTLNPEKCSFGYTEIKVLGFPCDGKTIKEDPNRVKCVAQMPAPRTLEECSSIFGFPVTTGDS